MRTYSLSHLDNRALSRDLAERAARVCDATADLLAHIAEFDARKLYVPAAYPSMHAYCVHVLHFSEGAAFKHIRVARAARDLGVSRPSLHDLLRKHAIDAAAYRRPGGGSDGGEEAEEDSEEA